jgi:hypothetical protein
MSLHPQDPAPAIPPVTITYTVNAIDFRNRTRVIVPCVLAARTTVSGQDPNIEWIPGPGFDGTVRVQNATERQPVLFSIAVKRFDGTRLHPTGIILRQANTIRPSSFVGAWKVNGPDGFPLLILSDNGLEKADYEFDLLIRDETGSNYGLLDPRLTNS